MIYSYDFPLRVRYVETDNMGIVHNSNYFRYFEQARVETMRQCGISYFDIEANGVIMPVVEQHCRYLNVSYWDQEITIRTTIDELPMAHLKLSYFVFRYEKDGSQTSIARGWNTLGFLNKATNKAMRCPHWIIEKLQEFVH
jgi:acyl-CoA thioester hydrolase, YbgC/YbaW family